MSEPIPQCLHDIYQLDIMLFHFIYTFDNKWSPVHVWIVRLLPRILLMNIDQINRRRKFACCKQANGCRVELGQGTLCILIFKNLAHLFQSPK